MASVPCQSHTQKARSRPGSGTGTQCSVTSLSVPILCPASSLEKHCVSTLSFLGKLGTNFRTSRRVHGRPGQAGLDRLLRDARSVSRFGRCPCPRRLGEGFGAPGLALKRCRPPWEVTPVGAPAAARKVTQAGSGQSQSTPTSRGHTELPRRWGCGCSLWVGLSFPKITVGFPCRYLPPAEATRPAPTARAFRPRRR